MPADSPQRRMIDINVLETSGVDHPAHGREGWLVKKSASAGRVAALTRILEGTAMPTKEDLKKEVAASKLTEGEKTFMTKAIDLSDDVTAAAQLWQSLRAKQEAGDPEVPTVEVDPTAPAPAAAPAPVAAGAPGLGADVFKSVTDPTERAALAKAAEENPALYKAFEGLSKKAEEALAKAAAEEAVRLDSEAVAKAKAEFSHLAIDHDEVAKAVRQISIVAPELAEKVTKALGQVEGQLEAADMFKEIGTRRVNAAGEGTAMAKAEGLAKSFVEAGLVKTHAEGLAKAFEENPALYTEHENEGTR